MKGISNVTSSSRELGSMTKFATDSFSSNPCQLIEENCHTLPSTTQLINGIAEP